MIQQDALGLLEECLQELEKTNGSLAVAMNKLGRVANLIDDHELKTWCVSYQGPNEISSLIASYSMNLQRKFIGKDSQDFDMVKNKEEYDLLLTKCKSIGLTNTHLCNSELNIRRILFYPPNIDFIEKMKVSLEQGHIVGRQKYDRANINRYLSYVKSKLLFFASELHDKLKYAGTIKSCFDVLKNSVDDKLLNLNPELAEQLMTVFKSVNTADSEQWSHALTSCRRLLEGVADELFPATKEPVKGRELKQPQYINRLWAFMDKSIESESNRDLAKAHVDYLGGWLQRGYKVTNKGVHAEIGQLEAIKLVFHIYLVLADILEYLDHDISTQKVLDLHSASMDEMEALSGISRDIAKEIVKLRVNDSPLTDAKLLTLKDLGQKTLDKIKEYFTY